MNDTPVEHQIDDPSEVFHTTRRFKKHKTEKQRRSEASTLYNNGHLVNPLGKPNSYGHVLVPERARPIPETGPITLAQLWKGYRELFEERFGSADPLNEYPGSTREAVGMFFDQLAQRFVDICNHKPEYRELYEYVCWFHEPGRMKNMIGKRKSFIHPKHLLGSVYVKLYSDDKTNRRDTTKAIKTEERTITSEKIKHLDWAFSHIRKHLNDKDYSGLAEDLHDFGLIVIGEYFFEEGYDSVQIRHHIIEMMVQFICLYPEAPEKAKKFLDGAWVSTKSSSIQKSSVWSDWKAECTGMKEVAFEQADREILRMKAEDESKTKDTVPPDEGF